MSGMTDHRELFLLLAFIGACAGAIGPGGAVLALFIYFAMRVYYDRGVR